MDSLYWGFLIFGIIYALVTLIFSDVIEHSIEAVFGEIPIHFFHPTVIVSGITTIGAAGILLTKYSTLTSAWVIVLAILAAVVICISVYFLYIKSMENRENSLAYSIEDLSGSIADVSISIPANGYGEVIVSVGIGVTNHIAAAWDQNMNIPQDTRVVVVAVKDGILHVSPLELQEVPH